MATNEVQLEKKASHGQGNGTCTLYFIEARLSSKASPPRPHLGFLLDGEWRRLGLRLRHATELEAGEISIPAPRWPSEAREHGLLTKEAAYALAARFQLGDNDMAGLIIETRLVEVKFNYTYSIDEIGVCEPFSLFEHLRFLKSFPRDPVPTE